MEQNKAVYRFIGRIAFGLMIAILLGEYLDKKFNTRPFILLVLIVYVVFGSLFLLIKETKDG